MQPTRRGLQVKESSAVRASHVNTGTAIFREDLPKNRQRGREFRHAKLQVEIERSDATAYGGLSLAVRTSAALRLPQAIDAELRLLHCHRPFTESDHVLTHVYNLFVGGRCIEDIAHLQTSDPVKRMLGASRIPDPTTAGDFLRRFDADGIEQLDGAVDGVQDTVWRVAHGTGKRKLGLVDLDSHVHAVYGDQKEGADFTYQGTFGYHPLAITLAETQECLRLINRPGNVVSAEGAAQALREVLPMLNKRFRRVIVRGDSAFARQDIYQACESAGQYFAMVSPAHRNLDGLADALPARAWKAFDPASPRRSSSNKTKRRKRRANLRRQRARQRGKRDLKLERQWVAEIAYRPARSKNTYRLIIRRQRIEESAQGQLFELWRYRYVITNLPCHYSAHKVMKLTYQRCDQENVIEQLQNGIAAMRMPTGDFLANWAFLVCARLAHNLKAWLAQLALPTEVMRWEWKRFRQAFVFVAATVVTRARQVRVRLASSHRFVADILTAHARLQV